MIALLNMFSELLQNLDYADDVWLQTENRKHMQEKVETMAKDTKKLL